MNQHILGGVPYAFRDDPALYDLMRTTLGRGLSVSTGNLVLVGSGKTGISLSPDGYGRRFSETSDLDFAVVSPNLFDSLWLDLLRLTPARYRALGTQVQEWLEQHQKDRIFRGRASPHLLTGATALAGLWFKAFKSVGRVPELASFEVHGMLFRTWDHLKLYHLYGLHKLRRQISGGST